jgi:hypothetical protein
MYGGRYDSDHLEKSSHAVQDAPITRSIFRLKFSTSRSSSLYESLVRRNESCRRSNSSGRNLHRWVLKRKAIEPAQGPERTRIERDKPCPGAPMITTYEAPAEHFSFGRGGAQRADTVRGHGAVLSEVGAARYGRRTELGGSHRPRPARWCRRWRRVQLSPYSEK